MEAALKIAFQYWQNRGQPDKQRFLKLSNGYHGDTLGSVSVGGIPLFHEIYHPLLFDTLEAPAPYCYRCPDREDCREQCLTVLEEQVAAHHRELAAVILEPIMQGAAGMIPQPPGYLAKVREVTRRYDVLLIADEVAVGFGRTGKMFACEHEQVSPDLMCLAKGITGGYLPLAATLATDEVYDAFLGEYDEFKTFFHGHTYTGTYLTVYSGNPGEIPNADGHSTSWHGHRTWLRRQRGSVPPFYCFTSPQTKTRGLSEITDFTRRASPSRLGAFRLP